ncbi:MAG: hypothetical protein WA418_11255 [Bradyrhizobium sp.]
MIEGKGSRMRMPTSGSSGGSGIARPPVLPMLVGAAGLPGCWVLLLPAIFALQPLVGSIFDRRSDFEAISDDLVWFSTEKRLY